MSAQPAYDVDPASMRSPAVPRRPELVLTFAVARPNDDVMGAAGLITKLRDHPPLRFVLAHATNAEAGQIHPEVPRPERRSVASAETRSIGPVRSR